MIGFAQSIVTVLLFILILGALVLIHELGHFVTARWANVRVLEFGIGFPPRAKVLRRGQPDPQDLARPVVEPALPPGIEPARRGRRVPRDGGELDTSRQGTLYTLNWLPIGGFVKLEGEDGDNANDPRAFSRARLPVKLGILVAGVLMNLLLAFVIFTGLALWGEPQIGVRIGEVVRGRAGRGERPRAPATRSSPSTARATRPSATRSRRSTTSRRTAARPSCSGSSTPTAPPATSASSCGRRRVEQPGALGIRASAVATVGTIDNSFVEAVQLGAKRTVQAFSLILVGLGDLGPVDRHRPHGGAAGVGPGRDRGRAGQRPVGPRPDVRDLPRPRCCRPTSRSSTSCRSRRSTAAGCS